MSAAFRHWHFKVSKPKCLAKSLREFYSNTYNDIHQMSLKQTFDNIYEQAHTSNYNKLIGIRSIMENGNVEQDRVPIQYTYTT